jgi:hypothetical protein
MTLIQDPRGFNCPINYSWGAKMSILVPGGSFHNLLLNRGYFLINWKSPM